MKNLYPTFLRYRHSSTFLLWLLSLTFIYPSPAARAQKLVQDSLILELNSGFSDSTVIPVAIDTLFDARQGGDPRLIGIDEVKQYGVIPVDLQILAQKPLAEVIRSSLPEATPAASQQLTLGLNQFELATTKPLPFVNRHQILAKMTLFLRSTPDSLQPIGELLFESGQSIFIKKTTLKTGYKNAFQVFMQDLTRTLHSCADHFENDQNPLPYNYRSFRPDSPWLQLNAGTQLIRLPQGVLVDGHLFFTHPEVTRSFFKSVTTLRYRQERAFETIEFSLFGKVLNYRINPIFLTQFKAQFFLGINRWKDMADTKHSLYDAALGDLSFSQSLLFHPLHARTLYLGLGLHQNVYYIHSKHCKFQPGFIFHLGMQL